MRLLVCLLFIISACQSPNKETLSSSRIINDTLQSNLLNRPLAFKIYLPEIYNAESDYPVLYLLHGHGGSDDDWFNKDEGDAVAILDSLIKIKAIDPLIAITLDAGNSWYVDSKELMETTYIKEFIPYIEEKYSINKDGFRIIAGNSAGGFGTLRFSLKYPDLFHSSILLSPAAYYPLPPNISSSRKIEAFEKDSAFNDSIWLSYSYLKLIDSFSNKTYPKFYTSTGDDDEYQIFNVVVDLKTFFKNHNIANETLVIDGGHTWDVWQYCFTNDLVRIFNENQL
jgi:enterochelin esterase-like enzyme